MKLLLKIFFSLTILMSFSSVKADTIKWLHLFGEDSSSYANMVRAVEEFEAKTGHTVVMQYLENESFKAKYLRCFNQMIDQIYFIAGVAELCMIKPELVF